MDDDKLPPLLGAHADLSDAAHLSDSEGHLGRRAEMEGSRRMYHVFPGMPARVNNRIAMGLTKGEVTTTMVLRNADSTVN